ncbi:hypothetical protein DPMN_001134 [Dreissena polymorpha]|uniref:Uncharacterized protein n=1 Tax=Dreissena polymorpha TaxID=45954 RepID=A0A9D4MKW9_DREPO|nr:hypothetical protein DPMN_001134 [Dreissena polymorpha]
MAKKKTHLTKYRERRQYKARQGTSSTARVIAKRLRQISPLKATNTPSKTFVYQHEHLAIKSPSTKKFKSARTLFSPTKKSPSTKKFKSARTLFSPTKKAIPHCQQTLNIPTDYDETTDYNETKAMLELTEAQLTCVTEDCMSNEENNDTESKLRSLIPTVAKELSQMEGHEKNLFNFFELVANKQFPLDNIAYLLWIDVVKWYSNSSTTQMRYGKTVQRRVDSIFT